jgi:hypothetical protein
LYETFPCARGLKFVEATILGDMRHKNVSSFDAIFAVNFKINGKKLIVIYNFVYNK